MKAWRPPLKCLGGIVAVPDDAKRRCCRSSFGHDHGALLSVALGAEWDELIGGNGAAQRPAMPIVVGLATLRASHPVPLGATHALA